VLVTTHRLGKITNMIRTPSRALGYLYCALAVAFWVAFAFDGGAVNLGVAIAWTVIAVGWITVAIRTMPGASIGRRLLIYFGIDRSGAHAD
jgi:uncharacterized RDD family membrane protein YckC